VSPARDTALCTLFALAVLGASSIPYAVAWRATPTGRVYAGTSEASEDDYPTYLAQMRAGTRGEWTYRSPYAPELERTLAVRPLYALSGAVSRALGAPLWVGYHAARLLAGGLLLAALWVAAGAVARSRAERWCGFALASVGSGVGSLIGREGARASWSYDLWVPEINATYSLLTNPHFPVAQVLLLAAFAGALRSLETGSRRAALGAGLAVGALAWIHTYDVVIATAVLAAFGAVSLAAGSVGLAAGLQSAVVMTAAALPFVLFQLAAFLTDPSLGQMRLAQPVGSAAAVAAGVGILAPLAAVGAREAFRRGGPARLAVVWAACVPLLLLLPLSFARRMVMGWHVPLGLLAGIGLVELLRPWGRERVRWIALLVAIGFASATTLDVLAYQIRRFARPYPGLAASLPRDLLDAYAWLAANATPGDVVLAPYGPSNWLPVFTDLRPYFGHWAEAPDAQARYQRVSGFYDAGAPAETRLALLREGRIAWVLVGEGALFGPAVDPMTLPGVRPVHRAGGVEILRVEAGATR
jgi:hypothetical protein